MREHQPIQIWRIQNHGIGEWDWRLDLLISWSLLMATRNPGEVSPVERLVVEIPIIYMVLAYHPNGCLGMGCVWTVKPYHLQGTPQKTPSHRTTLAALDIPLFPAPAPGSLGEPQLRDQMGIFTDQQLSLVKYPMIYKVLYIPDGCLGFLPSIWVYLPNPWMVGFFEW